MVTSSHLTKGMTPHWALVKMVLNVLVPKKAGPKQISSRQDFVPDGQGLEMTTQTNRCLCAQK